MGTRTRACALAVIALLAWAGAARANSGTQIPISQIQTQETAFIIPNGNFEAVTGSDATGWAETGTMSAAAPINTQGKSFFGNFAAQASGAEPVKYSQNLSLTANTNYILSGYIWNFGTAGGGAFDDDLALIELIDGSAFADITLEAVASDSGSGAQGYFIYAPFNSGSHTTATMEVEFDYQAGSTNPAIRAQFDNIGITPADQFVAPTVPEPGALSLLGIGAVALLRRRGRC